VDSAGRVDAEFAEQVAGGLGQVGALPEGPGFAGEGAQVDAVELAAHERPGLSGLILGDADEQERAALANGAHFSARWIWLAGLVGLGIGLCYPLLGAAAVDGLRHGDLAAATAVNQCGRQIGAALGVAARVSVLGTRLPTPTARFHEGWLLCGVFCLAAAAGLALRPRTSRTAGTVPPASPARQPEAVAE